MYLFRYFDVEEHADSFCRGEIRLSTLETCRRAEGVRGDREEAMHAFHVDRIFGPADDPAIQRAVSRTPFRFTGGGQVDMRGFTAVQQLPDAHVLCMTRQPDAMPDVTLAQRFGSYCIRINFPRALFKRLTAALGGEQELREGVAAPVVYAPRARGIFEDPPAPLGFVKPETFAPEREYRMLWLPRSADPIQRRFITIDGGLAGICDRVA